MLDVNAREGLPSGMVRIALRTLCRRAALSLRCDATLLAASLAFGSAVLLAAGGALAADVSVPVAERSSNTGSRPNLPLFARPSNANATPKRSIR